MVYIVFQLRISENKDAGLDYETGFMDKDDMHLKNRILVQGQVRCEFQPADILAYVENLKIASKPKIGPIDTIDMLIISVQKQAILGQDQGLRNIIPASS